MNRRHVRLLALCAGLASFLPVSAGAQQVDLQAVGGANTYLNSPHGSVGGLLHGHMAGWGVLGMGSFGTGSRYESMLYAGALTRDAVTFSGVTLLGFLGYGRYREVGWTDIDRSASGPLFGATARYGVGSFVASVTLSDLIGSYSGSDVAEPFTFHVPRLSLGLGFSLLRP